MSDQSQGPGWWLASDGKWYPPDQAPAMPPPETWAAPPVGPPASSGMSTGAKAALAVVGGVFALIALAVLAITLLGEESETTFQSTGTAIDGGDDDVESEGDVPRADVPDGYALIRGDGVSIAAPDGWREIAPEDFSMTPEEFKAAFPDAPPELLDQATGAFDEGATLIAFDTEDSAFGANVNIASFPGEAPLSLLEAQATNQLESFGGSVVSSDEVTVPAGDALRVAYTLDVAAPDGSSVTANGVQFYVHAGGRTHVVTISGLDDMGTISDAMADTFRLD
jgi:hypothetical protein